MVHTSILVSYDFAAKQQQTNAMKEANSLKNFLQFDLTIIHEVTCMPTKTIVAVRFVNSCKSCL